MTYSSSRRDFIKKSVTMGSLMMLPGTLLSAFPLSDDESQKVKLGVVGVGSRGGLLVKMINSLESGNPYDIVAVCDNYEPNFKKAMALTKGNAKGFNDHRKMLEMKDLDAIIVATPLHEHAHIVIDALQAGKHVFCEKSMARTLEEVRKMADVHYSTGKILQIGHQRLFDPRYNKGMEMIQNGDLGSITQIRAYWHRNNNWRRPVPADHPELERKINWRLYSEYSCGLMTELACHQIQVANWALNSIPVSVRGVGSINYWKDGREIYDNAALVYAYDNGTQLVYDSMISNRFYGLEEQIMGDKGTLEMENNRFYLEHPPEPEKPAGILQLISDIEKDIFESVPIGGASWIPETALDYKGIPIVAGNNTDGTREELIAFASAVKNNKSIPGVFEQGYHATVWSLLGQKAMETGETIVLPDFMKL